MRTPEAKYARGLFLISVNQMDRYWLAGEFNIICYIYLFVYLYILYLFIACVSQSLQ